MKAQEWLLIGAGIVILYLLMRPNTCTPVVTSTFTPMMDLGSYPGGAPVASEGSDSLCQSLTGQGNAYWSPSAGYCLVTPA